MARVLQVQGEKHQKRVDAGRKGGQKKASNAKAMLEQCSTNAEAMPYQCSTNQNQNQNQNHTQVLTTADAVVVDRDPSADPCPHKKIIAMYHDHMPTCRRVRTWNGQRPKLLAARWREHPDLEWWQGFLQYCGESAFLTGRVQPRNGDAPFQADLEWLVRPANFQKINEGKYHRGKK
jgi:hypothetical protein